LIRLEAVLDLPGYQITGIDKNWESIGSVTVERWFEDFLKRLPAGSGSRA